MMTSQLKVTFKRMPDDLPVTVVGRTAWALQELVQAGPKGITALENPAPRLAHYILCLRKAGLTIETIDEKHSGPFKGVHGRYILKSDVQIMEQPEEMPPNLRISISTGLTIASAAVFAAVPAVAHIGEAHQKRQDALMQETHGAIYAAQG
jgi:hypothetical protein